MIIIYYNFQELNYYTLIYKKFGNVYNLVDDQLTLLGLNSKSDDAHNPSMVNNLLFSMVPKP